MGKKNKSKDENNTYFKVFATFQCSNEGCKKSWNSAHGWEKDEELDVYCEYCYLPAKLTEAKDEKLLIDVYICPKEGCKNWWQYLYMEENRGEQECDLCGTMAPAPEQPQLRYGRHYVFECRTKTCMVKPEWEDFSTSPQKTQRCTRCYSRGEITNIQRLPPKPRPNGTGRQMQSGILHPLTNQRGSNTPGRGLISASIDGNYSSNGFRQGGRWRPPTPSTHISKFCDMCLDMMYQGYSSCHQYRKVITEPENKDKGILFERILAIS